MMVVTRNVFLSFSFKSSLYEVYRAQQAYEEKGAVICRHTVFSYLFIKRVFFYYVSFSKIINRRKTDDLESIII
jgi:hypothetical protein